jgi:hypothetical protein
VTSCDLVGRHFLWHSSHLFPSLKTSLLPPLPIYGPAPPISSLAAPISIPASVYLDVLFLHGLLLCPGDRGGRFLGNFGTYLPNYTASDPWRPYPEHKTVFSLRYAGHMHIRKPRLTAPWVRYGEGKVVPVPNSISTMPWRHGGSGGIAPPFLNSALSGGEWSASRPR